MKTKKNISVLFIGLGTFCIFAALVIAGYNIRDQYRAEQSVSQLCDGADGIISSLSAVTSSEKPLYELCPDMLMPVRTVDGAELVGMLYIEELDLRLPVISEWSYSSLKKAPCRYSGSAYKDNMVIAAHNYRSHFAGLRNISVGSTVVFTDMEANEFYYTVVATEVLEPYAVTQMVSSDYDLSLFTCTTGGRTRFTVRCVRN